MAERLTAPQPPSARPVRQELPPSCPPLPDLTPITSSFIPHPSRCPALIEDLREECIARIETRLKHIRAGKKNVGGILFKLADFDACLTVLDSAISHFASVLAARAPRCIQQINFDSSVKVLIVEQTTREVLIIARRVYVLRNGRVSFTGPSEELKGDAKLIAVYQGCCVGTSPSSDMQTARA